MGADVLLAALREEVRVERLRFDSASASGALSSSALASKEKKWSVTNDPTISETLHSAWRRMQKRGTDCSIAALAFEFFLQREVLELRQDEFRDGVSVQAINDCARESEYVIDQRIVGPDELVDAFTKCIPSVHLRRCITSWMSQGGFALLDRASLLSGKPVAVPGPATQKVNYSLRRNNDSSWLFQMWCTKENFAFIVEGDGQPVMVDKATSSIVKACSVTVREVPIKPRMQDVDVDHVLSKERVGPRNPMEDQAATDTQRPSFRITSGKRQTGSGAGGGGGLFSSTKNTIFSSTTQAREQKVSTELIVEVDDVKDVRSYTRVGEDPRGSNECEPYKPMSAGTHRSGSSTHPPAASSTSYSGNRSASSAANTASSYSVPSSVPRSVASIIENPIENIKNMSGKFNFPKILSPPTSGSSHATPQQHVYAEQVDYTRQQQHCGGQQKWTADSSSTSTATPSAYNSGSQQHQLAAPVVNNPLSSPGGAVLNAAANCLGAATAPVMSKTTHTTSVPPQQQQRTSIASRRNDRAKHIGGPPTFNNSFDFLDQH